MRIKVNRTKVLVSDFWIAWTLFFAALALYLRTMPPTVLDGDSGEYQYMAFILGVPHSTGYPLYILLGKLFTFLPLGDVAYRINLFSVVFAAMTAPVAFAVARQLGISRLSSAVCTGVLVTSPSVWGGAVEAKTYALHLFLAVLVFYLALRWQKSGKRTELLCLALAYGFGLTNHIIIRFIAPALLLLLWLNRARLNRRLLVESALLVTVPLLLYAYIPVRANQLIAQQDPANLELYGREDAILKGTVTAYYVNTLTGFFNLISGLDNSHKLEVTSPLDQMNRVDLSSTLLLQQFGWVGLILTVGGAVVCLRRDRSAFFILLTAAAAVGAVAFYLRGISTVFYFSITYFVLALWMGYGMDALLKWAVGLKENLRWRVLPIVASRPMMGIALTLLPVSALVANFPRLDESNNFAPRDYAQAVLHDNIAPNAVVVAPWEVSQPIRYFQFVENVRPDLLVVNVSPIQKQFETMLANAHSVGRPFYLVLFEPESKTNSSERYVQVVPLPLASVPQPRFVPEDTRIVGDASLLGYDIEPYPPHPGKPVRVSVYYRALARMYPIYSAVLSVTDLLSRPVGEYDGIPGSEYYPTYRWQAGSDYRQVWQFVWPDNAPSGLYHFDLSWFVYDLDTRKINPDSEHRVSLGTIRAGDFSIGLIENPTAFAIGQDFKLVGWNFAATNSGAIRPARGKNLSLDLFWRADRVVDRSYTVFVHLATPDGRVVADADGVPLNGLLPTDRWLAGETIRDRHTLTIPTELSPGDYVLEAGMYVAATGERLQVVGSEENDKVILTRVRVD